MSIRVVVIDGVALRGRRSAESFSTLPRAPRVEVDFADGEGPQLFSEGSACDSDLELTVAHHGDRSRADVLYTSQFRPEVVEEETVWVWRSIGGLEHLSGEDAQQILDWALNGKPHEEERRPPVLKRGRGRPVLCSVALLCLASLDQAVVRPEVLSCTWWLALLSGGRTGGEAVAAVRQALEAERWAGGVPDDWARIFGFVDLLSRKTTLELGEIEAIRTVVGGVLND